MINKGTHPPVDLSSYWRKDIYKDNRYLWGGGVNLLCYPHGIHKLVHKAVQKWGQIMNNLMQSVTENLIFVLEFLLIL